MQPALLTASSPAAPVAKVRDRSFELSTVPHRFLDIGHSKLAYWRYGQGPDLVFVHGWPLHSATFRKLVPELSQRFTCHLIDLPGAGQTQWSEASAIDLKEHVSSLRAGLTVLGLSRYALLAHDSGGAIARWLSADNAQVVALVLGNTEIPGHHPTLIRLLQGLLRLPYGHRLLTFAMGLRIIRRSPLGFAGCFADRNLIDGPFHRLFIAPIVQSQRVAQSQLALLRAFDQTLIDRMNETHRRITAPTLLLWGEQDPIFPLRRARQMVDEFAGGATLEVLAGGKAFVHEELSDAFATHAGAFLTRAFAQTA